jgi:hypothetical protein
MSKGLGHVAQTFQAILETEGGVFTTSELCAMVYETGQVKKKHRLAVLQSLRIVVERIASSIEANLRPFCGSGFLNRCAVMCRFHFPSEPLLIKAVPLVTILVH